MNKWDEMYQTAKAVQNERKISDYIEAGSVAAAIFTAEGKIYTGVCIGTEKLELHAELVENYSFN